MIAYLIEATTLVLGFIGFTICAHFFFYAISWGWAKGQSKVTKNIYNYHSELDQPTPADYKE